MSDKSISGILDVGIIQPNKETIIKFLTKLKSISINKPEIWEREIFSFFSENCFVVYCSTLEVKGKESGSEEMFESILAPLFGGALIWNSNEIFRDLDNIYESTKNGKDLNDYLEFFILNGILIRKMFIKNLGGDDNSFKGYRHGGVVIERGHKDCPNQIRKDYFLTSDGSVSYPFKDYSRQISENIKKKFHKASNKQKPKIRNPIESRLRHEVFKRDNYKCKECGKSKEETTLHADHIIPVSQGGTDELDNLQTLCQVCNLAKSNRKWIGGKHEGIS